MITVYINPKGGFSYIKERDLFTFNGKSFDVHTVKKDTLLNLSKKVKAQELIQTQVRGFNIKNEVFRWRKVNARLLEEYGHND